MTQLSCHYWGCFPEALTEVRLATQSSKPSKQHMHRVGLIESSTSNEFLGMVSDHRLLSWFSSYAAKTPSLQEFLTNSLYSFALPSLNIYDAVVASNANSTVLDAMKLMSEEGVSSVAVLDDECGNLLSAVSVTDIGKVCLVNFNFRLKH